MSELIPNILALDKGLDLQSPKLTAPPGSVLDSLNYEQVDFQGQKRIDGYTRYDGSPLSALQDVMLVQDVDTQIHGDYEIAYTPGGAFAVVLGQNTYYNNDYIILGVFDDTLLPDDGIWASESGFLTPEEHLELVNTSNVTLRSYVEELPGPISGLHWFRDRLYAVVDIENCSPEDTKINTAGNASLFESRSFSQVLEEDKPGPYNFGWRFVHQGWKVLFENGTSLFGELPALNQNRQGIGIEGPTSIELNNGAASAVTQKVTINGEPVQVNGWKDSTTSTTYSLNPAAIQYEDTSYIYADAYISWDADLGVVTAATSDLEENSPINTVELT